MEISLAGEPLVSGNEGSEAMELELWSDEAGPISDVWNDMPVTYGTVRSSGRTSDVVAEL